MERGDLTRARSLLDQAVAASATDVDARRQLAEALWQEGSREEALVHAERAVELDPRNAPTVARCGEMLMALGAVDQAQRRAEQALELDPTLPAAWALRGRAYRYRGEHERALADLHQALRYDPASEETLLDIAELQYQLGRPQRCVTTLQNLLESYTPGDEPRRALWLAGLAYAAVDRPTDAVDSLHAASQRGSLEPELLFQLARAQQIAGQFTAAVATARQAAEAGHPGGQLLLAQMAADASLEAGGTVRR